MGQPTPPRIVEAFAKNAPDCDPSAPIAGGKTNPFPATSQIGIVDGAASLVDGFVPLNMTDPTAGGIPPFGVDMNGALYLISAWAAFFAAGQINVYDATLQAAMGGYSKGARLSKAADHSQYWISAVDANMTDPDTGGAGWISSVPLHGGSAPTAGAHPDFVLPGPSDYIYDVDCTAGNININGTVAQRDGQRVTYRKSDATANVLTLGAGVGSAGNQLQYFGDPTLDQQYASFTIQWNSTLNAWAAV